MAQLHQTLIMNRLHLIFLKKLKLSLKAVKKQTFFLIPPLPSPHTPILPIKKWQGKSGLNSYADFVMQIDDHIGEINNLLKDLKISNNTIIIFTSDTVARLRLISIYFPKKDTTLAVNLEGIKLIFLRVVTEYLLL